MFNLYEYLVDVFYRSLLEPDDTFVIRCRKGVLAAALIICPATVFSYFYGVLTQPDTELRILSPLPMFIYSVATITVWVRFRMSRTASDGWALAWVLSIAAAVFVWTLLSTTSLDHSIMYPLAIASVVMNVPRKSVVLWSCTIPMIISSYNMSFGLFGYPILGISYPDALGLKLEAQATMFISMAAAMLTVFLQTQEYQKMIRRVALASSTALDVSRYLVGYDTASAAALLERYMESADVDTELCDTLQQIVSNLDLYRPFLPSHLVQDIVDAEAVKEIESGGTTIRITLGELEDPCSIPYQVVPSPSSKASPRHVLTCTTPPKSLRLPPTDLTRDRTPSCSTAGTSSPLHTPIASRKHSWTDDARVARLKEMGFRSFTATVLTCAVEPFDDGVGASSPLDVHARCQGFLEVCIATIMEHKGVILSVSPHCVVATWNAFRPCIMHEVHACVTALDLRGRLASRWSAAHGGVVPTSSTSMSYGHMAITSGAVLVGFVGTSQVKNPVVVGAPREESTRLASLNDIVQVDILLSESIAQKVGARFTVLPVDVTRTPNHDSTRLFALVGVEESAERHRSLNTKCELYTSAFSDFVTGKFERAMGSLHDFLQQHSGAVTATHIRQALRIVRLCLLYRDGSSSGGSVFRSFVGWERPEEKSVSEVCLPEGYAEYVASLPGSTPGSGAVSTPEEASHSVPSGDVNIRDQIKTMNKAVTEQPVHADMKTFVASNQTMYHRSDQSLGSGATSVVYLGMQDDGSLVALKYVKLVDESSSGGRGRRPKRDEVEAIIQEVDMLAALRHDNVVAYLGSAIVSNHLVIVTEYVSGGSLHGALKSFGRIPVRSVKRYLCDILRGLMYLHSTGIVHRDVKPHNVLLMIDGQCKLTDFGAASKLSTLSSGEITGTPLYMAPEACVGRASQASDIWALGILTVELLTGDVPWTSEQRGQPFIATRFIYRLGREAGFVPVLPSAEDVAYLPASALDFVRLCLQRDEASRPTASTLVQHSFLL